VTDVADRQAMAPLSGNRRLMMAVAVAMSLGVHVAVAWSIYDKPLLPFDAAQNIVNKAAYRIRRADPQVQPLLAQHADSSMALDKQVTLGEVSAALLANVAQPAPALGPPTEQPLHGVEDARPSQSYQLTDVQTSQARQDAKTQMVRHMVGNPSLEVAYVGQPVVQPASTAASNGWSADVRRILNEAAVQGSPLAAPGQLERPQLADVARPELRLESATAHLPHTNFGVMALKDATKLKVPQYLDSDFEYVLYTFKPHRPWSSADDDAGNYLRVDITGRRTLRKLHTMPRDVVYLIDTSGSVTQPWVDAAIKGIKDALHRLNKDDRFNIVMFKEKASVFDTHSNRPVNKETRTAAQRFMDKAKAGGFTDVNQALSRLLVRDVSSQRVYDLVLISDGQPTRGVKDTRELINLITRDNDLTANIYCIGIGGKQNRKLLEFLAYRNKGFCMFAKNSTDTPRVIRDLASRLRYPIIRDVTLVVGGLDAGTVFPRNIPNIHQAETFSIYGRFNKLDKFTMQVSGKSFDQEVAFSFTRDLNRAHRGDKQMMHDWAFWKLHHLYSEQLRRGDDEQLNRQIKWLRQRYKFKTMER